MKKLRLDPSRYIEEARNNKDPDFQLRLMRAFAETQKSPLNYISESDLVKTPAVTECLMGYKELALMEDSMKAYPDRLPWLEKISHSQDLYKPMAELFPIGANCIRSGAYLAGAFITNLPSNITNVSFYRPPEFRAGGYSSTVFCLASWEYFLGMHDLILENAAECVTDSIYHVHIIQPDLPQLEALINGYSPNLVVTYSLLPPDLKYPVTFYHSYRFMLLPWLLSFYQHACYLVGADVVFSASASNLSKSYPDRIGIYRGQDPKGFFTPWTHACGDLLYVPYNANGVSFATAVCNYIYGFNLNSQFRLYLDQAALSMCFNFMQHKLHVDAFHDLKVEVYNNCNLNSASGSLPERTQKGLEWKKKKTGRLWYSEKLE